MFYFVLRKYKAPNRNLVLGLFLINPFVFLNNVFSPTNCGYHLTDSFFYLFLLISLYFYPNEDKSWFYLFSGLAMCAKWFTLPAAIYFFIKFLYQKNWNEIKKIILFIGTPILIFLISPILYFPNYLNLYLMWLSESNATGGTQIPLIIKILIFSLIFTGFLIIRLKKADLLEIIFFSIILMFSIMFWARPYVRYLTPLIFYGHLKIKGDILIIDFNIKTTRIYFKVGNNLLTFTMSILGCIAAIIIIIFII